MPPPRALRTKLSWAGLALLSGLYAACSDDPAGGSDTIPTAELTPVKPNMVEARAFHAASLVGDGAVLLSGGIGGVPAVDGTTPDWDQAQPLRTLEIYDPINETFCSVSPHLSAARYSHTATELSDGSVLFAGGTGTVSDLATAERCEPTDMRCPDAVCTPVGETIVMGIPRAFHSATRIETGTLAGRVLIAGGWSSGPPSVASAELFDPETNAFEPVLDPQGNPSSLVVARAGHAAVWLEKSHLVLFVGGRDDAGQASAAAELFDPETGTFTSTVPLSLPRIRPTATLLEQDCVLVVGGHAGDYEPLDIVEKYEPCEGKCACAPGEPPSPRFVQAKPLHVGRRGHTADKLVNGSVLVVGGLSSSTELFDGSQFNYAGDMLESRGRHSATVLPVSESLPEGGVLIAGGLDDGKGRALATAEIYDVARKELRRVSGAQCSDDNLSVIAGDNIVDCGGLLCRSGRCLSFCETSLDCASGMVCRADGSCSVEPTEDVNSCAASKGREAPAGARGLWLVGALVWLFRRRRRA